MKGICEELWWKSWNITKFVRTDKKIWKNRIKWGRCSSPKIQRYSMENLIISRFISVGFPGYSH